MAHLITIFILLSTYVVVLKNSVGTLLYSLSLFLSAGVRKDPGPIKTHGCLGKQSLSLNPG